MSQIDNLRAEIARLEAEAREEAERIANLSSAQKIAELIHEKTCHYNHTDYCSFFLEEWGNNSTYSSKKRYLEKAEKLLAVCKGDEEMARNVVLAIHG